MFRTISPRMHFRIATAMTASYVLLLSYLLLTPEPLVLFGLAGGEIHGAVDATVSTYMQHTLAYAVLTALCFWWSSLRERAPFRNSFLFAGGHGFLTEWLQRFVPGRHSDV